MKRAVKSYRAASKSIVRMLRPHSMVIDVEFVLVAEALERFASTVFSYAQLKPLPATNINTHVSRFVDVATNYAALLIELGQDPATLLRCLQSPRLQHGLIGRNMLLFQGMAHILQIIYASQSVSQQKPTHNAVQASQTPQEAVRELLSASGLDFGLENTEAHQFWEENWPDEVRNH